MTEIFYRQLVPKDYDEYKRIRLDCLKHFPDNFGTTFQEEFNSPVLKLKNAIENANKSNFVFGAFTGNNELVGICGFIAETRLKTKHRGEISQMYVDPVYSGRGIGKLLLQYTIDKAFENKEIEQIILSAVDENNKAVKLYKQLGFAEYGKFENYFKSGPGYTAQVFLFLTKPMLSQQSHDLNADAAKSQRSFGEPR